MVRGPYRKRPIAERFWLKVDKNGPTHPVLGSACWIWTGAKHNNRFQYGVLGRELAHRVSWRIANGSIPSGLFVLHRCDNPPCVNPGHLSVGTQLDNIRDMDAKKRRVNCDGDRSGTRLHPETVVRGERRWAAKLRDAEVLQIRAEYAAGNTLQRELAVRFGVSAFTISTIVRGKKWKHLLALGFTRGR